MFTNRWVCKIRDDLPLSLDLIKEKEGKFWEEEGEKYTLRRLVKLDPEIKTQNPGEFISGRFYFNWEYPMEDYEIKDDKTTERADPQIIRRTSTVPFWISINQRIICFPNSKKHTKLGKETLARLFFHDDEDGILPVNFDVQAIERAWRNGEFSTWTYSFRERDGSINSGTHFGEEIDLTDPIYQQTITAPKNFIGIKMTLQDQEVKVRVTKNGTVTVYTITEEIQEQPELFRMIGELMRFQISEIS